LKGAIPEDSN